MVALAHHGDVVTTYAAASAGAAAAFVVAGFGLYAAGWLAVRDPATGSLSALCVLASAAWLAPALVGWEGGPPLARSIGIVAAPFLVPVVAHIAAAAPTGRVNGAPRRIAVAAAYGLTTLASVGYAITWDPFRDPRCWSDCTDNAFVLTGNPGGARLIEQARLATVVLIGVGTLITVTWQLTTATAIARAVASPIILPAALASAAEAVYAAARLGDPAEGLAVADDSMLTRAGLVHLLTGQGHDVVGQADNAEELVSMVDVSRPVRRAQLRHAVDPGSARGRRVPPEGSRLRRRRTHRRPPAYHRRGNRR